MTAEVKKSKEAKIDAGPTFTSAPSYRRRIFTSTATQTEASFPPDCESMESRYEELASEQFNDLCKLRDVIRASMREMASSVYDVVALKDVLFKIEDDLPSTLPVTDMLLLSSKLFRRTAELGRLLSCFFAVTFAEEHVDEHFRFTEVRVLRRELTDLRQRVAKAEEERSRLQFMLDDVGRVAMSHSRAVDLLEARNAALQLHSSGLEDQMALLFSQLNKDLHVHCKDAYETITGEIDAQYRMNLTKATFRQTMDSLNDQLRSSRTLINEVRELVSSCTQGYSGKNADAQIAKEPSIRFKLKQVEHNFQQLLGRFTSIKGIVAETAHELMSALQERKNILYLSLQHIRLYDIQNTKMRQSKAVIIDMKRFIEELLRRVHVTFPPGAVTYVDRIGHIATHKWQVGQTLATIRNQRGETGGAGEAPRADEAPPPLPLPPGAQAEQPQAEQPMPLPAANTANADAAQRADRSAASMHNVPFETIHQATDVVKNLDRSVESLNRMLNFENETNAFLQTLTFFLSVTPRDVDDSALEKNAETDIERALLPTGDGTTRMLAGDSAPVDLEASMSTAVPERSRTRMDTEETAHSALLQDRELKITRLQEQLDSQRADFASKIGFLRQVYESRIADLEVKEANFQKQLGVPNPAKESRRKTTVGPSAAEQEDRMRQRADLDALVLARSEWEQAKQEMQPNKKVRETALSEVRKQKREKSPSMKKKKSNLTGTSEPSVLKGDTSRNPSM